MLEHGYLCFATPALLLDLSEAKHISGAFWEHHHLVILTIWNHSSPRCFRNPSLFMIGDLLLRPDSLDAVVDQLPFTLPAENGLELDASLLLTPPPLVATLMLSPNNTRPQSDGRREDFEALSRR